MKTYLSVYILLTIFPLILFSSAGAFPADQETAANIYKTISVKACDSLIKANELNPGFVILDVRAPDVWASDHLTGSICRNYYDADFNAQLNALPKQKIFLLHCQSGARSGPTLTMMKNLNFSVVYEMSGGINAWKSSSLPTTAKFAPRLMLVSNGGIKNGTIQYGIADTLKITLTNRANDTLKFTSVTLPAGSEFLSDFDLKKKLKGAEDYSFSVFYKPQQLYKDSVHIDIQSNGGYLSLKIILKKGTVQKIESIALNELNLYPNPAKSFIAFDNFPGATVQEVSVINLNGQLVKKDFDFPAAGHLNIAGLPEGVYFIRTVSDNRTFINKLVISR
jgi:rhodanese-related sulfurtransferase